MHHTRKFSIIISQVKKHHWFDNNITAIVNKLENNITKFMDNRNAKIS
jgi:hypothetical protein